jgi:hypothetical protein
MSDQDETSDNPLNLPEIDKTKVGTAEGIAAIALSMALKYHDINTVQDGALYQQYKLEGRNMRTLHLDMVFETAIRIERHLLLAESRLSNIVIEALEAAEEEPIAEQSEGGSNDGPGETNPGE